MQISIEQILVELIQNYMDLPANYGVDEFGNEIPCVSIRAQNIKLFNTDKLQITVSTISNKIYSSRCEYFEKEVEGEKLLFERLDTNERRNMQVDVYSRNNDAMLRFNEVQLALTSTTAEMFMDTYQFKIGKISEVHNLSGLEGGSDINRYTVRFDCLIWQQKEKAVPFYNDFKTDLYDNKGKWDSFTIKEEEEATT